MYTFSIIMSYSVYPILLCIMVICIIYALRKHIYDIHENIKSALRSFLRTHILGIHVKDNSVIINETDGNTKLVKQLEILLEPSEFVEHSYFDKDKMKNQKTKNVDDWELVEEGLINENKTQ